MMEEDKQELLKELERTGYLKNPALRAAMERVDRADFVPEELKEDAYWNYPLPIGFGQTISQPLTVVFMLELLAPAPGESVLEIGAGSGWQTALLAELVSEGGRNKEGKVLGIERVPGLRKMAEKNAEKYGFVSKGVAKVVLGDGSKGAPAKMVPPGGFDKIIAGASGEKIPQAWKSQLKIGGRIVAPAGQSVWAIDKISGKEFHGKEYPGFVFVPLIEDLPG